MKKQAELGFNAGGENYDIYRPGYTSESVDLIVSEIVEVIDPTLSSLKCDILELGAGTGKMTDQLSRKLPKYLKYLASDPSKHFLDVLKTKNLNLEIVMASAGCIPLMDKTVGIVVCAQCFHWFSEKKDLESIHRVLIPGGKLILIWNAGNFDQEWMVPYNKQRMEIAQKVGGSLLTVMNNVEWRKEIETSPLFKLLWYRSLPGMNFSGDLMTVIASIATSSVYKSLPLPVCKAYLDELEKILKNWPGLDVNNITIPHTTELYVYTAM